MTLPTDAKQCTCGFDFDQGNASEAPSSEEIRLDAEELYETYLTARAQQATAAVRDVQRDFARDPANKRKAVLVAQAIEAACAAKEALAAQSAHIAQLKKSQKIATPPAIPIRTATAPVPVTLTANKKIENQPTMAKKHTATNVSPLRVQHKTSAKTTPTAAAANTQRVANIATAIIAKQNQPASALQKPTAVAPTPTPVTVLPPQTVQPNAAFRQAQAAKAERIVRENATPAVSMATPAKKEIAPKVLANEVKLPATVPAMAKTTPRLYVPTDKKECPNCTSSIAINTARCRCGYEFASSELLPSLSMSEEERSEFAKLFSNL